MQARKGTVEWLKAISSLSREELEKYYFIFAGVVDPSIKEEFYQYYSLIKEKANIEVFDKFCTYEFFAEICEHSHFLMCPYLISSQSSGILAYGAKYETPLITPSKGLLAQIVKKYELGERLNDCTFQSLAQWLKQPTIEVPFNKEKAEAYVKEHSIEAFAKELLG